MALTKEAESEETGRSSALSPGAAGGDKPAARAGETSRDFVRAVAGNLWLGGDKGPESPRLKAKGGDSRASGAASSPAELRRALWARGQPRRPDEGAGLAVPKAPPDKGTESGPAGRPSEGAGKKPEPDKTGLGAGAAEAALAALRRAEAELTKPAEAIRAVEPQRPAEESELRKQVAELKDYAAQVTRQRDEARADVDEEHDYFSGKLDEADNQAKELTARIAQLAAELDAANRAAGATAATPVQPDAEAGKQIEELEALQRRSQALELEMRGQLAALKEAESKAAQQRDEARAALEKERSDFAAQIEDADRKVGELQEKNGYSAGKIQEADGKTKELTSHIEALKSALANASSALEQALKQREDEKSRQAAAADRAAKREEELVARVRRLEEEAAARAEALGRTRNELEVEKERSRALGTEALARQKELSDRVVEMKKQIQVLSDERDALEERGADEDDERVGIGPIVICAITGVMLVAFVLCDSLIEVDANDWFKTLLKFMPMGVGLGFGVAGLLSRNTAVKWISGVLIALFVLHSLNREVARRLLFDTRSAAVVAPRGADVK